MKLGPPIQKILQKRYPPLSIVEKTFGNHDLAFKTDEEGFPILLFLGKKQADGRIKGDRFARRLVKQDGQIIKDHWDHKGKAT
ncbi:hypothetical protein U0035_00245 [Niabella yanshanensis]|uniref:Uncharacterized protein n=1 Tax=Niabella yanshanensis TaxID=577386 RepID=A0ABZ0W9A1_9BACT|nr:hypothetical protein [Niabella yanshanensis]WQD38575.1 hypothetical protein U0035_00245 [Niabella yanshanensis]